MANLMLHVINSYKTYCFNTQLAKLTQNIGGIIIYYEEYLSAPTAPHSTAYVYVIATPKSHNFPSDNNIVYALHATHPITFCHNLSIFIRYIIISYVATM